MMCVGPTVGIAWSGGHSKGEGFALGETPQMAACGRPAAYHMGALAHALAPAPVPAPATASA